MATWSPIDENALLELIGNAECILEGLDKGFWRLIKLTQPAKWQQHPYGNEGDGFWVVGIVGHRCVYYNDIEDGFNLSAFDQWGVINEYGCNQLTLDELISNIVASRFVV